MYFAQEMLKNNSDSFEGKKVCISGSGNVAQYAAEKAIELGAKILTYQIPLVLFTIKTELTKKNYIGL